MAGFGYKDLFKLVSARPRFNGKFDPRPRVECGFCGFQFYGGPTRQKSHLLGQKGGGVQICTTFESMDPDMFAELQLEAQQKQQEQQSQQARKRETSAASSSSSAKQQRLDGMLSKGCKAEVDAKVALLFYAEGIPIEKVGGAAHRLKPHQTLSSSMQARSKYFKEAVEAIGNYGPGYRPPSSELLRKLISLTACWWSQRLSLTNSWPLWTPPLSVMAAPLPVMAGLMLACVPSSTCCRSMQTASSLWTALTLQEKPRCVRQPVLEEQDLCSDHLPVVTCRMLPTLRNR